MQIQVDTREHAKEWERIQKQFNHEGVSFFRSKLYVGDYMSLDNPHIVVDRKKDLLEVCGNVTTQHERFQREMKRALAHEIKIIFLVEQHDIKCLEDVYFWQNPRLLVTDIVMREGRPVKVQKYPRATTGQSLYKCMLTIADRYGVRWEFCDKRHTGKKIIELLGGDKTNG